MLRSSSLPNEEKDFTKGQAKTIDALRKLAILFSSRGILGPQQQGLWCSEPNEELWVGDMRRDPLSVLGLGAEEEGPTKDNIWRVFNASNTFFRPDAQAETEAWDLIDSGVGELTIPLHEH